MRPAHLDPPHDIGFWEHDQSDRSPVLRFVGWAFSIVLGAAMWGAGALFVLAFLVAVGRALGWS